MEPGEFEALLAKASGGSQNAAIDLLQSMRVNKVHQPELVVLHGGRLLSNCPRKLGSEVWTVMEQVFLAAAELGIDGWRDYCLKQLTQKFPNSRRVERLQGIYRESIEDWNEAKRIYNKMLEEQPEDVTTRKRLIAMYKQRGRMSEAVDAINSYLETFCTDAEVWHELAEIYIEAGSLSRAVFCFEELLLQNPRSMYHILTHAELLYSVNDLELSRKYFSLAAFLDGGCLRALWGLLMVSLALAEKDKTNERMQRLTESTLQKVRAAYKGIGPHGQVAIALLGTLTSS
mmetsp:Transcript_51964/g.96139  ORF Transcript_51964/g.96139 Transcript_51964/m.96139 type:complete len:288 (-) Transcript_51964:76-939(-)